MRIRTATMKDRALIEELWTLGQGAFEGAPALMRDGTFEELLEQVERGTVLVAQSDAGETLGMVAFRVNGEAYVGTAVAVYPEHRKSGIGASLILAAHDVARELGAKHALAVTWDGHPHLAGFYASVGYAPAGRVFTKELA